MSPLLFVAGTPAKPRAASGKEGSSAMPTTVPVVTEIEPFPVSIPEHDLEDLWGRLDRVRLPEAETVEDSTQGIGLERLRSLLDAWREHDWRSLERRWNAIPHYRTDLDGLNISFWHVRSPEPDAFPLVLPHTAGLARCWSWIALPGR
jgi:hypothetical protein